MKNFLLSAAAVAILVSPATVMAQDAPRAAPVVVYEVIQDDFVDKVEAIGTLRANETVTLAATVTQTVTSVNFEDGQRVAKGDILVEMTSGEEKALIDQQQALVNETSKQLERVRELAKNGAASKSVVDERQRQFASAKAGMAALQSRLQNYIIVAPFDGVLGLRNISVGTLMSPGTTITTLDDDTVMKLDFSVPSVFLPSLKPGLEIVAKAQGFKESFVGSISAINSQINENTRAIGVRAIIPNPDSKLRPGLLMTVELLKDPRAALVVPEEAIIPEGRKAFVMVVDETKTPAVAQKREIVLGARRPGEAEVLEGLSLGEKVVTQGTMTAQNGMPVDVKAVQKKDDSLKDILNRAEGTKTQASPQNGGEAKAPEGN